MRKNKGFTLVELLVVVAIIGVLVAISIPIFTTQLHKARVATDWANIRSYFGEIQADFISTGEYNSKVPNGHEDGIYDRTEIDFLDGQKVQLKDGYFFVTHNTSGSGYQISYYCNKCRIPSQYDKHKNTCILILGS